MPIAVRRLLAFGLFPGAASAAEVRLGPSDEAAGAEPQLEKVLSLLLMHLPTLDRLGSRA